MGISNWPLEPLRFGYDYLKAHDVPLLIYQGRLNMLDRKPQEEGILDFCAEKGVGFIAFSPLAQGLLTDRYLNGIPADSRMAKEKFLKKEMLTPQLLEKLKYYKELSDNRDETLAEMALAWILHQKGVTSVLVGASSTAQLEKNLKSVSAAPFDEELYRLIDLRGHRTADTFVIPEESLGRAETEEHIQTHGDMVLVVGDIETDQFVTFAVLTLIE